MKLALAAGHIVLALLEVPLKVQAMSVIIGVIVALILSLALGFCSLSAMGLEVFGLIFDLSLLLGFLGIGLCIGPDSRE